MSESGPHFLVIRLSSIGDIVHALPAVTALGETFPSARIDWAIEARHAALLQGNPFVHRVLALDSLGWRKQLMAAATVEQVARSVLELRERPYDAAVDFQGLVKSGLVAWLSRSRERVGFAENWLREPLAGFFYTERIAPRGRRHLIEMNLALVERLGAHVSEWRFPLPQNEADERRVEQQLASLGAQEFIIVNPGGGWTAKRWPPAHYAELVRRLEAELPWRALLTGSADERELIQEILLDARAECAAYFSSTIAEFIALARRARLFVGGDTGPMHLAAAVGTPIVAIFASTDPLNTPERNGPFSPADITLSGAGPTHSRNSTYIQGVSVESVVAAIHERLARAHG